MKGKITIGEKYNPIAKIQTPAEAAAFFEECVQHHMEEWGVPRIEAERAERENIGYYIGYFSEETRQRCYALFDLTHPMIGGRP